jgi:hypothetical protein
MGMKGSLLTGFRALAFGIGAFILLAVSGIKVPRSGEVAIFIIGLAVFWFLVEKVFLNIRQKKQKPPGA